MSEERDYCDAGRTALFGGRWIGVQCALPPIHVIASDGFERGTIKLCHVHFQEAHDAGLVTEPFIGRAEFERRVGRQWES